MRRHLCIITSIISMLPLASANIYPSRSYTIPGTEARSEIFEPSVQVRAVQSEAEKITIIFHGLMVGRYKPDRAKFQVGIVNNIPDHKCRLEIWNGEGSPIRLPEPTNKLYEFEVQTVNNLPSGEAVTPYEIQKDFDRKKEPPIDTELRQDYRYMIDMEGVGLHDIKLGMRQKPFKPIFHVLNGSIRSTCLTETPLDKRKLGEAQWVRYGYVSEIVGVVITLKPGQKLVLREKKNKINLWECSYSSGKSAEARVLNLSAEQYGKLSQKTQGDYNSMMCNPDYNLDTCHSHFRYYYTHALNVDTANVYELKTYLLEKRENTVDQRKLIVSVFPYQCGMIRQSKTEDDIDEKDMP